MIRISSAVAIAALLTGIGSSISYAAQRPEGFCASPSYDDIGEPVRHFSIRHRENDPEAHKKYPQYRKSLVQAAIKAGLVPDNKEFVLHEVLSVVRYSGYGKIPIVYLVVCQYGDESEGKCRSANYYFYDGVIGSERIAEILKNILERPVPSNIEICPFSGKLDWSHLTPGAN